MNAGGFGLILSAEVLQAVQSAAVTVYGHRAHSRDGTFPLPSWCITERDTELTPGPTEPCLKHISPYLCVCGVQPPPPDVLSAAERMHCPSEVLDVPTSYSKAPSFSAGVGG